ncbi:TIM-barrel domain-containing protein [uncultured Zobellia sp.]|uniref:TIM-barrel domain-containing protein n=1 Tax=uncultured Zobellia sp. TaxID=255433 RepID=UPI002595B310|nr:TIM-barrel domain-containing protein [uncultured Zobellia sp.]
MNKRSTILLFAFFTTFFQGLAQEALGEVISYEQTDKALVFECADGKRAKLSILSSDMIRVQISSDGLFKTSAMEQLGFVKNDFLSEAFDVNENPDSYTITTSKINIKVEKKAFRIEVTDKEGRLILRENKRLGAQTGKGNILNFDMPADEHFFGFGFMRSTLDARGKKLTFKREYRWKGATVPYFMSTRGYAFYSNNVHNQHFDFTNKTDAECCDYYSISSNGGLIDYYIIYGPDFPNLLDRYTELTGKTQMVPRWAFGLQYRLRYYGNSEDFINVAKEFRAKEIPADIMALEPGWEEVAYSMDWKWSKKRFPNPEHMIKELADMGFKLDLWESGVAPIENVTDPKVRKKWFAKRKNIINSGVKMFKQDDPYPRSILSSELLSPILAKNQIKDVLMNGEELNNVANSLYSETLFDEYRKLTGERAIVMFHAYNASVASHRWPFQWAGDFQASNGMLNASLSGHAMVSYDIRNPYAAGWHQGFFTPFSVVDSWAYYREPWLYSESIENSHRLYACLRSRLVPYFYSSLWQSHKTALPIERPMVLNYTKDPNTYNMASQFMVGDWFLLALSDWDDAPDGEKIDFWTGSQKGNYGSAYLPEGKWVDYWSGEVHQIEEAKYVEGEWPEYMGGLLYVKAGAIIPMGQVNNYIGETEDEIIVLDVYPYKKSSYELYEDDGISYDYEKGKHALTKITSEEGKNTVEINISRREGSYKNMPSKRSYVIKTHTLTQPKSIQVDGQELMFFANSDDLKYNDSNNGWYFDAKAKKAIIKLDKGWKFDLQTEGVDPLATIPPTAKYERILWKAHAQTTERARKIKIEFPSKPVPLLKSNISALPADSFSKAEIVMHFQNVKQAVGTIGVSLEGPIAFGDGSRELQIDVVDRRANFSVISGDSPGIGKITVKGDGIETVSHKIPVYGKPVSLQMSVKNTVLVADGENEQEFLGQVYDANGVRVLNVASPLIIDIEGEALSDNGMKKDSIAFENGNALFHINSTYKTGEIKVNASFKNIRGNTMVTKSEKGEMQVRMNPPEKVKLDSDGGWIPDNVTVFLNFKAGGQLIKNSNKKVTLNVYDKNGTLLDTYSQKAKKGEVIFKDISYYKRPAQCLFEIKCEGYETVRKKVFENTWDVDPATYKNGKRVRH